MNSQIGGIFHRNDATTQTILQELRVEKNFSAPLRQEFTAIALADHFVI